MSSPRTKGLLAVHGAVLLFGLAGLFGKLILMSPLVIAGGRCLFAVLTLGAVGLLTRSIGRPPKAIAISGALLAAHWAAFFHAIQISTVAVGLLSFSIFPVIVAVLEPVVLGDRRRFDGPSIGRAALACAGVAVVFGGEAAARPSLSGAAWGALSGLLYAIPTVLNRRFLASASALTIGLWQSAVAGACLTPFAFARWTPIDLRALGLIAVLGVVFTGGAHTLFIHGMRSVSARTASLAGTLEPIYGTIAAVLVLREAPGPIVLAGGALIVLALLLEARRAGPGASS